MTNLELDLKKIEKQTLRIYHEDGLLDILGGLILFCFGLFMWANAIQMAAISWIVWLAYLPGKQNITYPRIGFANYAPSQNTKLTVLFSISAGVGVLFFLLTATKFFNLPQWEFYHSNILTLIGLAIGAMVAGSAWFLKTNRYYIYGILILAGFTTANYYPANLPVIIILTSLIIVITGSMKLVQFIRKYPPIEDAGAING